MTVGTGFPPIFSYGNGRSRNAAANATLNITSSEYVVLGISVAGDVWYEVLWRFFHQFYAYRLQNGKKLPGISADGIFTRKEKRNYA